MEHQFIYHSLLYLGSTNWILVATTQQCSGNEIKKKLQPNAEIQDCATECEGVSSMFIFSIQTDRCYCETSATAEGTCATLDNSWGYDLYKYGI